MLLPLSTLSIPRLLPFSIVMFCLVSILQISLLFSSVTTAADKAFQPDSQIRRPVALALSGDGSKLFVANSRTGSISTIDLSNHTATKSNASKSKVIHEIQMGHQLSDMVRLNETTLLATDELSHVLYVLRIKEDTLEKIATLPVSKYPVSVASSPDGKFATVASLWSRTISLIDLHDPSKPKILQQQELPFAPRKQLWLSATNQIAIADSFGGKLAILDASSLKTKTLKSQPLKSQPLKSQPPKINALQIQSLNDIDGHNIRGLAISNDDQRLLIAHQVLNPEYATTKDDVHWGDVMSNVVRSAPLKLLNAKQVGEKKIGASTSENAEYLGFPDSATGDPNGLLVTKEGNQIVALGGIAQIGISNPQGHHFHRIDVGKNPAALLFSNDQQEVYVANRLSDSISVVSLKHQVSLKQQVMQEISLGSAPKLTLGDQGEMLFYDSTLASDGWYSCHSCHTDGHTNGKLNDNFGDHEYGTPKRVLSLLGTTDTNPWAWNGESINLEAQIQNSVITTMRGSPLKKQQLGAIVAFLERLPPAPSLSKMQNKLDQPAIERGHILFQENCETCHRGSLYTSDNVYDVGFKDERGNSEFNPPSLRGVSQRAPYLHDNRAKNLEEVLTKYKHGTDTIFSKDQRADLLHFLNSL